MTDKYIASLLSSIKGWNTGVHISIADESNKKLAELLETKQKSILELQKSRCNVDKRIENVKKELESQTVILAKKRKISESMQSSVRHENNRVLLEEKHMNILQSECKKCTKNFKDVENRRNKFTLDYLQRKATVESLSDQLQYEEETLRNLVKVSSEKDQDFEYLSTLWTIDKNDTEKTERRLKKLQEARLSLQKELETAALRTSNVEMEYQKQTEQFRKVHSERNQAVERWKEVLDGIKRRDLVLKNYSDKYTIVRSKFAKVSYQIEEQQNLLSETAKGHLELTFIVEQVESILTKKRYELNLMKDVIANYQNAKALEKSTIERTTIRLKPMKEEINKSRAKIFEIKQHLETITFEVSQLKEYAKFIQSDSNGSQNRTEEINRLLDEQEKDYAEKMAQFEKIRSLHFQYSNLCTQLKNELKTVEFNIDSHRIEFKHLRQYCMSQEIKLGKSKQDYYKLELTYLEMRQRFSKLLSPEEQDFNSETKQLQTTLQELQKDFQFVIKQRKFLEVQKTHTLGIVGRISQEISDLLFEKENLNTEVKTNVVLAKSLENSQNLYITTMQNLKVEHTIVAFEKAKIKQMIRDSKETILTLDQYRQQLRTEAEIRRSYIKSHKQLLELAKRKLMQDKSFTIKNVHEVLAVINIWKIKYQNLLSTSESNDMGDEGEAYFILKHAQEKELMRRESFLWESRVKEAEAELVGLQNNLSLVTNSNHLFKNTLMPVPDKSPEMQGLLKLQTRYRDLIIRKKRALIKLEETYQEYENKERKLNELSSYGHELSEHFKTMDLERNALMQAIMNQKAKIERAELLSKRCIKCLNNTGEEKRKLFEAHLHLKATIEKFNIAIKCLSKAVIQNKELWKPTFEFLVTQEGFSKVIKDLQQAVDSRASLLPKLSKSGATTVYRRNFPSRFQLSSVTFASELVTRKASRKSITPLEVDQYKMEVLYAKEAWVEREVAILESKEQIAHARSKDLLRHLMDTKNEDHIKRIATIGDIVQETSTRPLEVQQKKGAAKKAEIRTRLKSIVHARKRQARVRRNTIMAQL